MSRIVLGVNASHSTLMNTHWHEVADNPRALAFRNGLDESRSLIAAAEPDVVVVVGSNHFRGFWLDLLPAFTVGVGDCTMSGESGTPSGPIAVDTDLARHIVSTLVEREFDPAFSASMQIDHGITHAVQYLLDGLSVPIIPIVVNVFAPPLPTLRRCEAFGRSLGIAIAADGANKRVVVIGSGGLSHALPFPKWDEPASDDDSFMVEAWTHGRTNWQSYDPRRRQIIRAAPPVLSDAFDSEMLQLCATGRLHELASWTSGELAERGGNGAQELRSWLITAAACGHATGRTLVHSPMPEWLTGMAISVIEPDAPVTPPAPSTL
jgi:2,3-dihydroxyphenylpropionate 1,2-dioxygenase